LRLILLGTDDLIGSFLFLRKLGLAPSFRASGSHSGTYALATDGVQNTLITGEKHSWMN